MAGASDVATPSLELQGSQAAFQELWETVRESQDSVGTLPGTREEDLATIVDVATLVDGDGLPPTQPVPEHGAQEQTPQASSDNIPIGPGHSPDGDGLPPFQTWKQTSDIETNFRHGNKLRTSKQVQASKLTSDM